MFMICYIYYIFLMMLSVILFLLGLYFLSFDLTLMIELNFMTLNSNSIVMMFLFDWMSLLFMSFVLLISSMVINYSNEYMYIDKNLNRFILLILLFVFSMIMMIISPNLISILLGWDGLGLISFCLIIYYQNIKSMNAGMMTIFMNRIGDVFILMSIVWMMNFGSWNFYFYIEYMKNDMIMSVILSFILISVFTKSAQIPFSSWLPIAMAAPTPISALVHSSTLVTAGIYLLIRFNLGLINWMMNYLLYISIITMFIAGMIANFEYDLKKIIAYSTLSQLGFIMSILSFYEYKLAMFHLLTHALFKSTLFMCAGSIIHNFLNNQDIRYMGKLIYFMPLTCIFMLISILCLCGLPFLSGFYSKELILEIYLMYYSNWFIFMMYYISLGLTVCYSFRLIYFLIFYNKNYLVFMDLNDNKNMLKSMSLLIFLMIIMGSLLMWLIMPNPYFICLPLMMKMMAFMFLIIGMILGINISLYFLNYNINNNKFIYFIFNSLNLNFMYSYSINYWLMLSMKYYENLDHGWIESMSGQKFYLFMKKNSMFLMKIFINNFYLFIILMLFWIFFLIMI
uniref:NADH-ubiquinone oxidoreductase chain 5 n=1 Tax=Metopiellus crypticus TaxID=3140185 RepID=A0AAT9QES6_9COLE|nr:NADH dehydrogenase subunit 5 [Metopiellus sp.]